MRNIAKLLLLIALISGISACKKESNVHPDNKVIYRYKPNDLVSTGVGVLAHVNNYDKNLETYICGTWDNSGKTKAITQVIVKEMGTSTVTVMNFDSLSYPRFIFHTDAQAATGAPIVIRCDYSAQHDTVYRKTFVRFDSVETRVLIASQAISGTPSAPSEMDVFHKQEQVLKAQIAPAVILLCGAVGWALVAKLYTYLTDVPRKELEKTIQETQEASDQTNQYLEQEQANSGSQEYVSDQNANSYGNDVSYGNNYNQYNSNSGMDYETSGGVETTTNTYGDWKKEAVNDCIFYYNPTGVLFSGITDSVVGSSNQFVFTGLKQATTTAYRLLTITPNGQYRSLPLGGPNPVGPYFSSTNFVWSGNSLTVPTCDHWSGNPWYAAIWTFWVTRNGISAPSYSVLTISERPTGAN